MCRVTTSAATRPATTITARATAIRGRMRLDTFTSRSAGRPDQRCDVATEGADLFAQLFNGS